MNRRTTIALATVAALLGPGVVTGVALAGTAAPAAPTDTDDSTIIDLGDGIKVDVCLYVDLDDLLDDLGGEDEAPTPAGTVPDGADDDGGLLDLGELTGDEDGPLGLDLIDELLDELGQESFGERKAKCDDDPPPTTTPTTTVTATPAPRTTIIQRPTVTRSTTVYRSGQTRAVPRGAPETGGGPVG